MPEASFADLQTAIAGFNDQVKSYAVQSAVTNASQRVQELQNTQLDEIEKRNQLQQLSGQLALQLTGLGASGAQIQGAVGATQPKPLDTYGQMYAEGLNTGSEPLKKKAKELKTFMNEDKFALAQMKMQQDMLKTQQKQSLMMDNKFYDLVPKVQENYNKSVKALGEKLGQIDLAANLSPSSPADRIRLTTSVKSVGQDVGAIGDAEADAVLPPSLSTHVKRLRNFMQGTAESTLNEQQAATMKKLFKEAMPGLRKIIASRTNQYAYQLMKTAKLRGHDLSIEDAKGLLVDTGMEPQAPASEMPKGQGSASAPAFDIKQFLTPLPSKK